MEMLLIVLFHMLAVVSIKNNMKKTLIIIIFLLLLYIGLEVSELINNNCECNDIAVEEAQDIVSEHQEITKEDVIKKMEKNKKINNSIHVDYSKVETEQRRQGTMVIIMN